MTQYHFDRFIFDASTGELRQAGAESISLRHKVSGLLEYLLRHRERLVTKDELLDTLWQHGDYRENSLTQSVRELRRALGDSAQAPTFIKTYSQRGYQWICPLAPSAPELEAKATVKRNHRSRGWLAGLAAALLLTTLGFWQLWGNETDASTEPELAASPQLLVLPFANDTGDSERDWLELGLSDMLAGSLQRAGRVRVTPPAISQGLLLAEGLEWPTLPANLKALLRERGYDQALVASVREHGEHQVLDFQLLFADGRTRQGSMTYASLTANSDAMAQQLMFLIQPQANPEPTPENPAPGTDAVLASQAWAQGLSALQTSGAARADDYFQAALLLTPNDPWLSACRGQTRLLLGDWDGAEQLLKAADDGTAGNPAVAAFARYWQAELAYRTGDDERAQALLVETIELARPEHNVRVLADAYRLRARIAWSNYQWHEHRELHAQANELLPPDGDLRVEAEKLFYLGKPISQGPEKDPQRDLLASQERLQKALNYYAQLENRPMIAASQFALAQNYRLDLDSRRAALEAAIALYEQLQQPYELAEVLIYGAFFQLQLHEGAAAELYVERAEQVIEQLGDHRRAEELAFYRAFALLDQGLDQSHAGRHGQNPERLRQAIAQFQNLIESADSDITRAHALILTGWAHTDLEQYQQAQAVLSEGRRLSEKLQLETSAGNAVYSLMHLHLRAGDYDKVLALAEAPVVSPQQLSYLARAHYELGNSAEAADSLISLKNKFPDLWTEKDEHRLAIYQTFASGGEVQQLSPEPPAHSVYCESDWLIPSPTNQNS